MPMVTIVVAGAHSKIGKTTLASALLRGLEGFSALKVTVAHDGHCQRESPCGVCHNLDGSYTLVKDESVINTPGKDTYYLKKAGAKRAYWLISRAEHLSEGLKDALAQFGGDKGVVIEGTSVLKHLDPDLAIFIGDSGLKPSAKEILDKVDVFIK